MSQLKRKRASNFLAPEIELLLELVEEKKDVIENTKTDGASINSKQHAWESISQKYNSLSTGVPRSSKELKEKYMNLKKEFKKNRTEIKRHRMDTGGGPFKNYLESSIDNTFLRIIPHEKIDGLTNSFDSDACNINIPTSKTDVSIVCSEHVSPENILSVSSSPLLVDTIITTEAIETLNVFENTNTQEAQEKPKWDNFDARSLKTAKSKKLTINKNNSIDFEIKKSQLKLINKQIELCENQIILSKLQMESLKNGNKF